MLNLKQELRLQQKLSPQQIQYIKLLQLPTLALEQRIQQELEVNPLLEEGAAIEETSEADPPEVQEADDDYDWEELLPGGDDLYGYKARVDTSEEWREIPLVAQESLADHLRAQKAFLSLTERDTLIAEQIIGSIDEDGYLRRELVSIVDDIMFNHGLELSEDDVLRVLHDVQRLDPVGIAARSLKECLYVQLEMASEGTPGRSVALKILDQMFEAFTRKRFAQIKGRLGVDDIELKTAFDLIQRCNPKPGEGAFSAQENYITPDFLVRYEDDDFTIYLNGKNTPQLHVSRAYRKMLEQLSDGQQKGPARAVDQETRKFLRNKFDAARWFIDSIRQRHNTLLAVMQEIVSQQEAFFAFGKGHLRPLILKDIADRLGMDISTISRVVSGKYVQCNFGVYELKYFFSEGVATESGDSVSNKEVKAIIASIINEEDKAAPLSDQRMTAKLRERGFQIARRTVTKYREQLGIPVARLRREIVLT